MKNWMKAIKFVVKRLYFSFWIRYFDRISDRRLRNCHSSSTSSLALRGFEVLSMSDLFERSHELQSALKEVSSSSLGNGFEMSWDLPNLFWDQVLNSEVLARKVTDYLGDSVRLDDAYLKTITDGLKSVSEGWHDDNVGYRLKLFIVFDVDGVAAPTIVLPARRPKLYRFKLVADTLRIIFNKSNISEREGQETVRYQPGSCLLFDTNIEHRGGYAASEGVRHCVIVEFICRNKARSISSFSPCGPRQGQGAILIGANVATTKEFRLLDESILTRHNDGFLYGAQSY